jgi:hypothetical protein
MIIWSSKPRVVGSVIRRPFYENQVLVSKDQPMLIIRPSCYKEYANQEGVDTNGPEWSEADFHGYYFYEVATD